MRDLDCVPGGVYLVVVGRMCGSTLGLEREALSGNGKARRSERRWTRRTDCGEGKRWRSRAGSAFRLIMACS